MKENFLKKIKTVGISIISALSLLTIVWLLFFGKIKASEFLAPLLQKIPKDELGLTKLTEQILGEAAEKVRSGELKKAAEKGSEIFETSEYVQPARDVREDVKQKVDEVIESVKDLPAQEIEIIKRQVCKEWFEEVATESGRN